jgi:hypothetical protein
MADKAITQFTEMTSPANADVFAVVDVSEALPNNQNKKLRLDVLLKDFVLASVPNGEIPYRTGDALQSLGKYTAATQLEINAPDLYLGLSGGSLGGTTRNIYADGSGPDINITLNPKGSGTLKTPVGYDVNVSDDEDLINKKYFDTHAGGSGVDTWLELLDTDPTSYTGYAGDLVRVNSTPNGLEFVNNVLGTVMSDVTYGSLAAGDYFRYNGSVWTNYSLASAKLELNYWDISTTKVYYSGGDVGIGTSNPLVDFHVKIADDAAADTVFFGDTTGAYGIQFKNATVATGFLPKIWFFPHESQNFVQFATEIESADDTGTVPIVQFKMYDSAGGIGARPLLAIYNNTALRTIMNNDGNWGFNVSSPTERIDVSGNVKLSGVLSAATITLSGSPSDTTFSTSQLASRDSSGNLEFITASGGGTTNFLRADGTWAAPGGAGSPGGSDGDIQYNDGGSSFGGFGNYNDTTGELTLDWTGAGTSDKIDRFTVSRISSGVPAAGFGMNVNYSLENAGSNIKKAAYMVVDWEVPTDSAEDTRVYWYKKVGGTDRIFLQAMEDLWEARVYDGANYAQIIMTNNYVTQVTYTPATNSAPAFQYYVARSTGTVANGFGGGITIQGHATDATDYAMADITASWVNATAASRVSDLTLSVHNITTQQDLLVLTGGTNPKIDVDAPVVLKGYTFTGLPAAASHDQGLAYVTDQDLIAISDGSDWLCAGVFDLGTSTRTGAYTINCRSQQQYSESIETTDTTATWTISNLGKSALISIRKTVTGDKQVTLQGTGLKFVDLGNKAAPTSSLVLIIDSNNNDEYSFELSMWDTNLLDATDRIIHVTLL